MLQILVVQILAFVGLVALLRWLFTRNVTAALDRLDLLHRENLRKEDELNVRLHEAETQRKERIQQTEEEVKGILSEAKVRANESREEVLRQARQESERIIQEAHERREELRRELEKEVEEKAVRLASDAVRFVLTTRMEEGVHRQLVDELLAEMGELDPNVVEIRSQQAEVISSQPLEPQQRRRLKEILAQKAGRPMEVNELVDRKVIAGMVIRLDSLVLDGSLRNKLHQAVAYVRKSGIV